MALNRARGAMIGALCGDAFGSQVEFMSASSIAAKYPRGLTEIAGSPVWHTSAGQATDDGELALSLARSIAQVGKYDRATARAWYRKWYKSSPFDIGGTTRAALCSDSAHPRNDSQANGSLMRIIPLAILSGADAPDNAAMDSGITHPNPVPRAACAAYVAAAQVAIATGDRYAAWRAGLTCAREAVAESSVMNAIARSVESAPTAAQCGGGNQGWVLIATQLAFYHLLHAESFRPGLEDTVARGGDTDTNGCIVGGMLGALFGFDGIPVGWRETVLICQPGANSPRPRPSVYWPSAALGLADAIYAINHPENA